MASTGGLSSSIRKTDVFRYGETGPRVLARLNLGCTLFFRTGAGDDEELCSSFSHY